MKVSRKDISEKYVNVWTTRKVNDLMIKENKGEKLHMNEKIWFDNKTGIRKANVKFALTGKEKNEWAIYCDICGKKYRKGAYMYIFYELGIVQLMSICPKCFDKYKGEEKWH